MVDTKPSLGGAANSIELESFFFFCLSCRGRPLSSLSPPRRERQPASPLLMHRARSRGHISKAGWTLPKGVGRHF